MKIPCRPLFSLLAFLLSCSNGASAGPKLPPVGDPWATRPITAGSADFDVLQLGATVYASCASCHLADGGGRPDGDIPRLAGQPAYAVIEKLTRVRSGEVFLPVMSAFANSLSPLEVTAVSAYIATLPAPAYVGQGDGTALPAGRNHYAASCAFCHGARAEGNPVLNAPRLCGQHAGYVLRRVNEIVTRVRVDADPGMAAIAAGVAPADLTAIADYLSREPCAPPAEGGNP